MQLWICWPPRSAWISAMLGGASAGGPLMSAPLEALEMEEADRACSQPGPHCGPRGRRLKDGVAGICPRFQDASTGTAPGAWAACFCPLGSLACLKITSVC